MLRHSRALIAVRPTNRRTVTGASTVYVELLIKSCRGGSMAYPATLTAPEH